MKAMCFNQFKETGILEITYGGDLMEGSYSVCQKKVAKYAGQLIPQTMG